MTKIPSDDILESLYKLRIRESEQLKTVLELYDMEIHQKISTPNYQKIEDNGEKKYGSETSNTKFWRHKWGVWDRSSGCESQGLSLIERWQGVCYQWKAKGQCSTGDQCSIWHDEDERAKSTPETAPLPEPPTKKEPQRPESVWEDWSTAVQRLLEGYLYLITLWLLASSRFSVL